MCGGIVSVLSASVAPDLRKRPRVHLSLLVAFNLGRVLSYTALGAAFGAIALGLQNAVVGAQVVLRILAGVVLVGFGLHLTGGLRAWRGFERMGEAVWRPISGLGKRLLPVRSSLRAMLLGSVWGFIPCGMVYSAISLAIAGGEPVRGALSMAAFGVGTLPAMLLAGTIASRFIEHLRRAGSRRAMGIAMAVLGASTVVFVAAPHGHAACDHRTSCCTHMPAPDQRTESIIPN
jgi:sulfite exporter TauE/SafE